MTPLTNFTMTTVNTLPITEMTANVTTSTHMSFFGKLFGQKRTQTVLKKKQKKVGMNDNVNKPVRFRRGNDNPFSDFTEPYEYKKSTLPIIMDTTTSTNDGKKHLGYADIQSKTTLTAISTKMTKNQNKFKKLLNKILRRKQKGKQKRDAFIKLHRDLRFSPFKKLKHMFQATTSSSSTPTIPSTKFEDDHYTTDSKQLLDNKDKNVNIEKKLPNIFDNHLAKENKAKTKPFSEHKNIIPSEEYGGFKLEDTPKPYNWKSQKDYIGSEFTPEYITNHPPLKFDPLFFKTDGYPETSGLKNERLNSFNKYLNKINQLTTTLDNTISNDFMLGVKFYSSEFPSTINPFTQFSYDLKTYSATLIPNAQEVNANFDLNTKFDQFKTNSYDPTVMVREGYGQTDTYDTNNNEAHKYGNSDNNEPRKFESLNSLYYISTNPLWQSKVSNDIDNKQQNRVYSKADTGKLNIKFSLESKNQTPTSYYAFEEF